LHSPTTPAHTSALTDSICHLLCTRRQVLTFPCPRRLHLPPCQPSTTTPATCSALAGPIYIFPCPRGRHPVPSLPSPSSFLCSLPSTTLFCSVLLSFAIRKLCRHHQRLREALFTIRCSVLALSDTGWLVPAPFLSELVATALLLLQMLCPAPCWSLLDIAIPVEPCCRLPSTIYLICTKQYIIYAPETLYWPHIWLWLHSVLLLLKPYDPINGLFLVFCWFIYALKPLLCSYYVADLIFDLLLVFWSSAACVVISFPLFSFLSLALFNCYI